MWPYWLLYILPAFAATLERSTMSDPRRAVPTRWPIGWVAVTFLVAVMVGYRFEVGGDWFNYIDMLDLVAGSDLTQVLTSTEPGYRLLNWISLQMGWDIVAVNAMGAAIFALGLAAFCRDLQRPWLALTVAIPYLVIVVGMGYSRQGIALSLAMLGLAALRRRSTWKFVFWVVLGATFHRTAVLLLPIGALIQTRQRFLQVLWIGIASVGAYVLILSDQTEYLYVNYVEAEYQSEGALVRLLMNAVPAVILFARWKRFKSMADAPLWAGFALLSLALLVVVILFSTASTAVDRIGLYMLPLQLVVFSALPDLLSKREESRRHLAAAIVLYYAVVLMVWLTFATHSIYWIPYRFYPLEFLT
jgi:hypothetical protein